MNLDKARAIKDQIATILGASELPTNYHIDVDHGHFGQHSVKVTVSISEKTPDAEVHTEESDAWAENAVAHGLTTGLIFSKFNAELGVDDTHFKIVGWNSRAEKMPIILVGQKTKRRYKVSVAQLKDILKG